MYVIVNERKNNLTNMEHGIQLPGNPMKGRGKAKISDFIYR